MRHIPGGRGEPLGAAYLPIGGERHVDAHALARRAPCQTRRLFAHADAMVIRGPRQALSALCAREGGGHGGSRFEGGCGDARDAGGVPPERPASLPLRKHGALPTWRGEACPTAGPGSRRRRGLAPTRLSDGRGVGPAGYRAAHDPGMPAKACSPDTARYTGKAAVPPAHPDAIDVRWLRTEKETRVAPGLPRTTLCGAPGELSGPGRRRPRSWRTCCRQSRRTCGDRRMWRR